MWERLTLTLLISSLALAIFFLLTWLQRWRLSASEDTGQARLLYFYGRHCSACATQSRFLDRLDEEMQKLVLRIDVEAMSEVAQAYRVMTLPTTIILGAEGQVAYVNYGLADTAKLERQLTIVEVKRSLLAGG